MTHLRPADRRFAITVFQTVCDFALVDPLRRAVGPTILFAPVQLNATRGLLSKRGWHADFYDPQRLAMGQQWRDAMAGSPRRGHHHSSPVVGGSERDGAAGGADNLERTSNFPPFLTSGCGSGTCGPFNSRGQCRS